MSSQLELLTQPLEALSQRMFSTQHKVTVIHTSLRHFLNMEIFVPGRVCLLGEHTDWAVLKRENGAPMRDGHCLVYGTNCGLSARVEWKNENDNNDSSNGNSTEAIAPSLTLLFRSVVQHPPHLPRLTSAAVGCGYEVSYETQPDHTLVSVLRAPLLLGSSSSGEGCALESLASGGSFFSYVAGTALEVRSRYHTEMVKAASSRQANGMGASALTFSIDNYRTDLPVGKGLSSSAAVCVLVARALTQGLLGITLDPSEEMELAYLGERRTPSKCGRMDQCVAHGAAPISMVFKDDGTVVCERICIPTGVVFFFVVADMNRSKNTQRILEDLHNCFEDGVVGNADVAAAAREFLGNTSSDFVTAAMNALREGSAQALGNTFVEYQAAFDTALSPACPTELESPRLHELLTNDCIQALVFGGKGVGSQGDGTIQFVCRSIEAQAQLVHILNHNEGCHAFAFELRG